MEENKPEPVKVDTVISYCTNDFRFIKSNIEQCLKFSNRIIIPVCDHLLDGTPENKELLEKTYQLKDMGNIVFIEFEWNDKYPSRHWHNVARWLGHIESTTDYVLHIDADEIFQGDLMKEYLETRDHENYDVVSFACYWYFREPTYQSTKTEIAGSLFKRDAWTQDIAFTDAERWSYRGTRLKYKEPCTYGGRVISNHFSWVRTKDQMLKKVKSWGHNKDKNWTELVEEEFSRDFNGTDFVHAYSYNIVNNTFNV